MATHKLDHIDFKILSELQAEGRITNVELSHRVDISAPPCLRRVRTLEDDGYITGYHAELDPKRLGFQVQAYCMVGLDSQADPDLKEFEARIKEWPLVRECYMLNGVVDFLLKVVATDLESFQNFLTHELTAAPHVSSVKSSLIIRAAKKEPGVPPEYLGKSIEG